jgi:copper(I)-binding protein
MPRFLPHGLLLGLALAAQQVPAIAAADVHVDQAWARAARQGDATGAAYVSIVNHGTAPDRLLAVASDVAQRAEVHEHRHEQGMMRMRPLASLPIAAGATVTMQPMGTHIMLFGINKKLTAGERFTLRLRFEQAGEIALPVTVKPVDYLPGAEHGHHH